jgi:predicted P-loop ATPase
VDELRAEMELGKLIDRRVEKNRASEEREALWAESVRAYHDKRRWELTEAWASYHREQAERLEKTARELAAEHREKAQELMTDGLKERK